MGVLLMKLSEILAALTRKLIFCEEFKNSVRKSPQDFTRKRKMMFEELIMYMLISLKRSTQGALRRFFTDIGKFVLMKQQSLSEARAKIAVGAFVRLFKLTVDAMTEHSANKWHNYRVYAIDGVKIALPADPRLLVYYGGTGKTKSSPTAQGSALYDVLNDIVADAAIVPLSTDERTLAKLHIDACRELAPDGKKLLLFDRGYPSFDLIEKLEADGLYYLMRVKSKFNADIDAQTAPDGYVWLKQGGKRIHVRGLLRH